jgi:hypothetical protein
MVHLQSQTSLHQKIIFSQDSATRLHPICDVSPSRHDHNEPMSLPWTSPLSAPNMGKPKEGLLLAVFQAFSF